MSAVELKSPAPAELPPPDPEAYALERQLRTLVHIGVIADDERGRQRTIGASQVGTECARQLAFRQAGTRPSNVPDPLRALVGRGMHGALAGLMERIDCGAGRLLVEQPIRYRGVPGTVDLFDRVDGLVVDWKTTTLAKIKRVRESGPPSSYVVQLQLYAAGLESAGETVRALALCYLPVDGTLVDVFVWRTVPDRRAADAAVDKLNARIGAELESVARPDPSTVAASPSALCRWCDYYKPGVASSTSCAGDTEGK